jgi:hypothetical protein
MHASIKKKKKRNPNIFENDNSTTHTVKVNAKTSHTRTTIVKKDTTSLVVGRTPSSSRSALIPVPPSSIVGILGHLHPLPALFWNKTSSLVEIFDVAMTVAICLDSSDGNNRQANWSGAEARWRLMVVASIKFLCDD